MIRSRGPRSHTQLNPEQERQFHREFDEQFRLGWKSDVLSVLLRLAVIALGYGLLARAISEAGLGPGYVVLMFLVELVVVMWLGWALSRTLVREPVFQRVAGKVWVPIGWTLAVLTPYLGVLAFQSGGDTSQAFSQLAAWVERAWTSGFVLAIAAVLAGLAADTWGDVRRWQARGGRDVFVWPATMQVGLRFAAILALPFLLLIPAIAIGSVAHLLCSGGGQSSYVGSKEYVDLAVCFGASPEASFSGGMAWTLFAWLLLAELLVLFGGAWLHRRQLRAGAAA